MTITTIMSRTIIEMVFRVAVIGAIAVTAVGCAKDVSFEIEDYKPLPGNGIHKIPPKKTITIKRKTPTINNPSPRPLSADYPTDEDYGREPKAGLEAEYYDEL